MLARSFRAATDDPRRYRSIDRRIAELERRFKAFSGSSEEHYGNFRIETLSGPIESAEPAS